MRVSIMLLVLWEVINQLIEKVGDSVNAKRSKHIKVILNKGYVILIQITILIWGGVVEMIRNSTEYCTVTNEGK